MQVRLSAILLTGSVFLAACGGADRPVVNNDSSVPGLDMMRPPDLGPCGGCAEPTPMCDTKTKKCVACLVDNDCGDANVCKAGACVIGCNAKHPACGDAGSCDLDGGVCHGCLSDRDCKDPKSPFCDPVSGHCGSCSTQNDRCPDGQYCGLAGGVVACRPGCKSSFECTIADGGGQSSACCNNVCVDLNSSLDSCGACGAACNLGACCTGKCVDPQKDTGNCGGCGKACPMKNNAPTCAAGVCGAGACLMGFADCDGNAANGCEVATVSDPKNCGGCGMLCNVPNAVGFCFNGACAIGSCKPGFRDCNMNAMDGCEIDISKDPANCGACNNNCSALPHAVAGCSNSACVIGSCQMGWADCNKMDIDGCEAQLASDIQNCGQCGKVCPAPPHVSASCMPGGACSLGGCLTDFADCNGNAGDGCEINIASDPKNCGGCGMPCNNAFPNAQAGCAMGGCALGACNPGWSNCDGNPANGCELNTSNDVNNCGGCGITCNANGKMGQCTNGQCVYGPACANGSYSDCNPQGSTLINGSAFVDQAPPQGWTQCFGFLNTNGDDVSNTSMDNCLNTTRLRLRVWDSNNNIVVDNYDENLTKMGAWPGGAAYMDGCNCRAQLTSVVCTQQYWPCGNNAVYYVSTQGTGGGGCGGYAAGGPAFSNGNGGQLTVAVAQTDGREIWQGPCYGNQQWVGFKTAIYR